MTKNTLVKFVNNTQYTERISPINSSIGRWEAFDLLTGQSKTISDSHGGSGNYDIEFNATLKNASADKAKDVIVGDFRVDNPWRLAANFKTLNMDIYAAEDISSNPVHTRGRRNTGVYYSPSYWESSMRAYNSGTSNAPRTYGRAGFKPGQAIYYTPLPFKAFDANTPLANVRFAEVDSNAYKWDFVTSFTAADYTMPAQNNLSQMALV